MAEQDSHNVVIQTQSTGGSAPLVDDASNHNTAESATPGAELSSINDNRGTTSSANSAQPDSLTNLPSSYAELTKPKAEAEPSAGNAVSDGTKAALLSQAQEVEDGTTPEASDNESGKPDAVDQIKDGSQHNRTNSVKKPTTFSRVAVTKNFLAKAASTTPAVGKVNEKAAPVAMAVPLALKPRLVAKSASTLSNTLRARNGADGSPAPETGTVWNKNRPAPAMPAKQFTDEELKQQYGIHLATRLQTDENIKGAKWADIDDDEDDWAPEAVVWMDGTKSTVPAESAPPAITKPEEIVKPDTPKPSLTVLKKLGDPSTVKTILKPGAAIQAKQQSEQAASTNATDRPALKAKSPAPVPVKSPWATLPPVEKVSPINPPVQAQTYYQPVFASQDARVSEGFAPAAAPAREIAADTFDRSWREGEGERRELFNSASGKYEPAPEGRRNSFKHDGFGRKPAVLSRMSQDGRVNGDGAFAHRRGSSVSHASGPSARGMSFGRGSDSVASEQPSVTGTQPTPIGHTDPWPSQLPPVPTLPEGEDPVKAQERIMREKREAARVRRQEEEAREEAAKQERLKAKLNALAGAGLSRKERQAAADSPIEASKTDAKPADATSINADSDAISNGEPADLISSSLPETSPRVQQRERLSPSTASRATFQSQNSGSYRTGTQQTSAFSSPGDRDRKLQPFGRTPAGNHDSFTPWPTSTSSSNVWGVAGIGNGTFEGSAFAPLPQMSSLPPPPGMGRPGSASRAPQVLAQEEQLSDQNRAPGSAVNARVSQGLSRPQHGPGPIGPPSRSQQSSQRDSVSAWQAAAAQHLPNEYHLDAEAEAVKLSNSALGEPRRNDVFKETFRQTNGFSSRLGGSRGYEKTEYSIHDAQGSRSVASLSNPVPPNAQTQPVGPEAQAASWKHVESAVRLPDGSQNPAHGGKALKQPPIAPPSVTSIPQHAANKPFFTTTPLAPAPAFSNVTPPPPETSSHPVYANFSRHPNVRLPPPPPVVKLPPATAHLPHPAIMQQRGMQNWGPQGHGQPIVKDREWQARFNGLLGRTSIQTETPPSPPRTPPKGYPPVIAVASSSRSAMDEASLFSDATVSLPQARRTGQSVTIKADNSQASTSKQMVQHMFNDELGFGSRPKVRIPKFSKGERGPVSALLQQEPVPIVSQSKPELPLFHLFYKRPGGIFVKLPGPHRNKFMPEAHKARAFSAKAPKPKHTALLPKKDALPKSSKRSEKAHPTEAAGKGPSVPPTVRKRSHKKASPAPASAVVGSA